jgi:hypothetical protein
MAAVIVAAVSGSVEDAHRNTRHAKPWFDKECHRARHFALQALQLCREWECLRQLYLKARRNYKNILARKQREFTTREEVRMIEEAESQPHRFKRPQEYRTSCPISSEVLTAHFLALAQGADTIPTEIAVCPMALSEEQTSISDQLGDAFTVEEVEGAISKLKLNKAEGVDRVRNEHLKSSPILWPFIAMLFTACLQLGKIPTIWRTCLMVVIPKGKGPITDPASWRGISMKCILGKLFSSILAQRLQRLLDHIKAIPPEQHGFVRGRSTETAMAAFMEHVGRRLDTPKGKAYVAFIDFKAAFDTASRSVIIEKLAKLGVPRAFLHLLANILGRNSIIISDGLRLHPPFDQTTGLPQGDTFSSLLFTVLLHDLPEHIKKLFPEVDMVLYADDIVLIANSLGQLRNSMEALIAFCATCGLEVNASKTKAMKCRRGGRMAASDVLVVNGRCIEFVSSFSYLGFVVTPTLRSFSKHLTTRRTNAICCIYSLPDLRKISISTAMKLFDLKIAPCISYGIRLFWHLLTVRNLQTVESVKTTFVKRLLGLSKYSKNRITYMLVGCRTFVEDIQRTFQLEKTKAYLEFIQDLDHKLGEVDYSMFLTPAFLDDTWRSAHDRSRHLKCRAASHGFHHKLCQRTQWHEADELCVCRYCAMACSRYHFLECAHAQARTLAQLNMMQDFPGTA